MSDAKVGRAVASPQCNRQDLFEFTNPLFDGLTELTTRRGSRGPEESWSFQAAALVLIGMVLDGGVCRTDRFEDIRDSFAQHPWLDGQLGTSFNGLLDAAARHRDLVLNHFKSRLADRVWSMASRVKSPNDRYVVAVDGTKFSLPRTRSNEKDFGVADNGITPQAFVTTLYSLDVNLPVLWQIGEARSSEREHLTEMLPKLPPEVLLVGDAQYVGYELWSKLDGMGIKFLVRVGGNITLLEELLDCDIEVHEPSRLVHAWPRKQRHKGPPIALRLIRIRTKEGTMYLLTNIFSEQELTVKVAAKIYRQRWEIELYHRTVKQTLEHSKVFSRKAKRARLELEWLVIAVLVSAMVVNEAARSRPKRGYRLSPARLFRVLRRVLLGLPLGRRQGSTTLAECLLWAYVPESTRKKSKASRTTRRSRDTPAGCQLPPRIVRATAAERAAAREAVLKTSE